VDHATEPPFASPHHEQICSLAQLDQHVRSVAFDDILCEWHVECIVAEFLTQNSILFIPSGSLEISVGQNNRCFHGHTKRWGSVVGGDDVERGPLGPCSSDRPAKRHPCRWRVRETHDNAVHHEPPTTHTRVLFAFSASVSPSLEAFTTA